MASRNRGRKKPKLRDLSRVRPTKEEKDAVFTALTKTAPPITTAILGVALLEYDLDEMIRARFYHRDDDTWNDLTGDRGPLGTLGSKIAVGYAFGLYNKVVRGGLDTVRAIRNQFAHAKKLFDFSHELIIEELRGITLPTGKRSRLRKELSQIIDESSDDPQEAYIGLCLILSSELLRKQNKLLSSQLNRARRRHMRQQYANALRNYQPPSSPNALLTLARLYGVGPIPATLAAETPLALREAPKRSDNGDK